MYDLFLRSVARWLILVGLVVFVAALWAMNNGASAADLVPAPTVTLQQSLADIITSATSGVKAGVAFLQQEIPDVIRQLIVYNLVYALVAVLTGVALLIGVGVYWIVVIRGAKKDSLRKNDYIIPDHLCVIGGIFTFVGGLSGAIFIIANIENLLKLWIAPKVWLIEYGASLIK